MPLMIKPKAKIRHGLINWKRPKVIIIAIPYNIYNWDFLKTGNWPMLGQNGFYIALCKFNSTNQEWNIIHGPSIFSYVIMPLCPLRLWVQYFLSTSHTLIDMSLDPVARRVDVGSTVISKIGPPCMLCGILRYCWWQGEWNKLYQYDRNAHGITLVKFRWYSIHIKLV